MSTKKNLPYNLVNKILTIKKKLVLAEFNKLLENKTLLLNDKTQVLIYTLSDFLEKKRLTPTERNDLIKKFKNNEVNKSIGRVLGTRFARTYYNNNLERYDYPTVKKIDKALKEYIVKETKKFDLSKPQRDALYESGSSHIYREIKYLIVYPIVKEIMKKNGENTSNSYLLYENASQYMEEHNLLHYVEKQSFTTLKNNSSKLFINNKSTLNTSLKNIILLKEFQNHIYADDGAEINMRNK